MLREKPPVNPNPSNANSAFYELGKQLAKLEKRCVRLVEHKLLKENLEENYTEYIELVEKDEQLQKVLQIELALVGAPWARIANILRVEGLEPNEGTAELRIGLYTAHASLSQSLMLQQRGHEALPHFRKALEYSTARNVREAKLREAIYAIVRESPLELEVYGFNKMQGKRDMEKLKESGNKSVAAGKFDEAAEFYAKALRIEPDFPVLFTNRAICRLKKAAATEDPNARCLLLKQVVQDAEECISLDPSNIKAMHLDATALLELGDHRRAFDTLYRGLRAFKGNPHLKDDVAKVQEDLFSKGTPEAFEVSSNLALLPQTEQQETYPSELKWEDGAGKGLFATEDMKEDVVVLRDKPFVFVLLPLRQVATGRPLQEILSGTNCHYCYRSVKKSKAVSAEDRPQLQYCSQDCLDVDWQQTQCILHTFMAKIMANVRLHHSHLAIRLLARLATEPETTGNVLELYTKVPAAETRKVLGFGLVLEALHDLQIVHECGLMAALQERLPSDCRWLTEDGWLQLITVASLNMMEVCKLEGAHTGVALYLVGSFINHSCMPNVVMTQSATNEAVFVTAARVRKGEPLCITYTPEDDMETPKPQRQNKIFASWRFKCRCVLCEIE
eukprot:TRINITY_DN4335_c0_g1_i1.p1 TRINITY_DN4335_c0_g1~~TRINITY_DN4335_c0_g1_i1.p1  ORF type:complete len:618 (-),score=115.00 TRINITY_DN4335_c0_g1_i1:13-1866(-)